MQPFFFGFDLALSFERGREMDLNRGMLALSTTPL
jgi:hypothetical protein